MKFVRVDGPTKIDTSMFEAGQLAACRAICSYCGRGDAPVINERGVLVHRTFSSRELASDHHCAAVDVYISMMDQECEAKAEVEAFHSRRRQAQTE